MESSIEKDVELVKDKKQEIELSLSLMTFNILFENPLELLSNDSNVKKWSIRKEHVKSAIINYSPDIVCIQECMFSQLGFLKSSLEETYSFFGASSHSTEYHWSDINPIFFKKEIFSYITGGTFWYSDSPHLPGSKSYGNWIPRTFTWLLLQDNGNKDKILVVNTHLDVMSEESREMGVIQLANYISSVGIDYDLVFLAGDFNELKYGDHIFGIFESSPLLLEDSIKHADEVYKLKGTFNGFIENLNKRIDYIFYRDMKSRYTKGEYLVIEDKSENDLFISDHYPVLIKLLI